MIVEYEGKRFVGDSPEEIVKEIALTIKEDSEDELK
jgi:hypothetical protein